MSIEPGGSYLHEGRQVGVVVVEGGNNVEFNLDQDTLAQVILVRDGGQSVKQFNLGSSVRERFIKKKKKTGVGIG